VPLDGDDITRVIEQHRGRAAVQRQMPRLDPPSPHQPPIPLLAAEHPEARASGERGRHVWLSPTMALERVPGASTGELFRGFARQFTLRLSSDCWRASRMRQIVKGIREHFGWRIGGTEGIGAHSTLGIPIRFFPNTVRERGANPRRRAHRPRDRHYPGRSTPEVRDVASVEATVCRRVRKPSLRLLGCRRCRRWGSAWTYQRSSYAEETAD